MLLVILHLEDWKPLVSLSSYGRLASELVMVKLNLVKETLARHEGVKRHRRGTDRQPGQN